MLTVTSTTPVATSTLPALIVTPLGKAVFALILRDPPLGLTTLDTSPLSLTTAAVPVATLIEAVVALLPSILAVASVPSAAVNLNVCSMFLRATTAPTDTPD